VRLQGLQETGQEAGETGLRLVYNTMRTFREWLAENDNNAEQSHLLPQLKSELLGRINTDQEMRNSLMKLISDSGSKAVGNAIDRSMVKPESQKQYDLLSAKCSQVDQDNLVWMKNVVTKYGWPTISKVGAEASNAAWLLVQHFDTDNAFQKYCLSLMTKAGSDVNPENVQKLTNRVNIRR
jgi:hypothetical protein